MIRNMELKTYKQKVRSVLEESPKARNNDGALWAYYINKFHRDLVNMDEDGEKCVKLRNFRHLPTSQSIRLARQLVQNEDGEFLPTDPKVIKQRGIKEENIRNAEWREAKQA